MVDDPAWGVRPGNVDNLSITGKRLVSPAEEHTVFMARPEIEAILRIEKENASGSSIYLNLKPPYAVQGCSEAIPGGYITP